MLLGKLLFSPFTFMLFPFINMNKWQNWLLGSELWNTLLSWHAELGRQNLLMKMWASKGTAEATRVKAKEGQQAQKSRPLSSSTACFANHEIPGRG